jgi:5-methylcytosine-specific restriction endonuclease McrA
VDAAVGAQILNREEGVKLLNELENLLGACTGCNSSKGAQIPGNTPGTWMPNNPSPRAVDIMRRLGTWSDEGT